MAKDSRDAVVSVRISQEEQAKLRGRAEALGVSVSELLRSTALAAVEPISRVSEPVVESTTGLAGVAAPHFVSGSGGVTAQGLIGFQWTTDRGLANGSTLTI